MLTHFSPLGLKYLCPSLCMIWGLPAWVFAALISFGLYPFGSCVLQAPVLCLVRWWNMAGDEKKKVYINYTSPVLYILLWQGGHDFMSKTPTVFGAELFQSKYTCQLHMELVCKSIGFQAPFVLFFCWHVQCPRKVFSQEKSTFEWKSEKDNENFCFHLFWWYSKAIHT